MNIEVQHDTDGERFVAEIEGQEAYLSYKIFDNILTLYFAFTPPALRGKEIAKLVVEHALDYAKDNNLKVIPTCSYVQAFISNNEQYKNLLA
jgi:predicted GNAT family acetyltransferase